MQDQERPSRKLKSENRLYSFLTRSRSRSRSKNDPPNMPSQMPSPGSKPASRIQSRPLSSTTTATNTTVTPATPRATRRPPTSPTTPVPSTRRKLFGISIGRLSSSRSRSRSRPSSPHASLLDVPPLPGLDDDPTPRPRRSFSPHAVLPPRSPSPTPTGPKVLRVTNATTSADSTGSTAASIKITKFFSKGSGAEQKRPPSGTPPMLPPIPSFVSAPLKRVSSLHQRNELQNSSNPHLPPKIVHTPPTPLKNGDASNKPPLTPSRAGYQTHALKGSLDSGIRYRGAAMGVVDEEGVRLSSSDIGHGKKYKGKAKELVAAGVEGLVVPRPAQVKMTASARSTKHGSFDFERPGWGAAIIQRSGSNGTTGSGWSSVFGHKDKERESSYGPGLAGVGTLQREASMKRAQEREAKVKERERKAPVEKQRATISQSTTPEDLHTSTSTAGGKSSSMSKATGKRLGHKGGSGSGVSRFIGLKSQHGPFSFEPPVPSPTRSTGSTGTATTVATAHEVGLVLSGEAWKDKGERERERVQLEKERERERRRAGRSGDRAPVPVPKLSTVAPSTFPTSTNAGYRSGTKGRSLDLGLGLSWAPTKVREEALLPSSAFFNRSLSNGSSTGVGRSTSGGSTSTTTGQGSRSGSGGSKSTMEPDMVERSRLGREVAEVFKNALQADGYRLFKNYVHQFDAHEIPFDGPTGIVTLVERLLATAPHLSDDGKRRLLDKFVRIILQHA